MPRDRNSDQPISAEELRLVEALYGEAPDSEVDKTDELEGYRGLRSMFADLPEEDPPAAITAKLMSAAADAVKARAPEKRGFWARLFDLFQPLAAHPALAAAASLVLVATIGGVMVMSGRTQVSEPRLENAPVETKSFGEGESAPTQAAPEIASEEEVAADEADEAAPEPALEPPPETKQKDSSKTRFEAQTMGAPARESLDYNRRAANKRDAETRKPGGGKATGTTGIGLDFSDGDAPNDDGVIASDKREEKPQTTVNAAQREQSAKNAAEVETLTSKARRAAKKGDCALVRKYTERIRQLDSAHYKALVARDSQIRRCLTPNKRVKSPK